MGNPVVTVRVGSHGYVQGVGKSSKAAKKTRTLCHYFGGVPYALPPIGARRWKKPQPLPRTFSYGTETNPGGSSATGICPQPDVAGRSLRAKWTEDCLQCNIWVPVGEPPAAGWPVFFFLHGGYLQWGHPNEYNFSTLLGETDCRCVIVMPAYRLNVFGFLASEELRQEEGRGVGNYGFWDQRQALEWTAQNIRHFGGNADSISMGGFSAGGYSAYHQLAHDVLMSPTRHSLPLIKRLFVQSNGPGTQPRPVSSAQEQFEELLDLLDIPGDLPGHEKLSRLREVSSGRLIDATEKLRVHEFRAVSEDDFVSSMLFDQIDDGTFAGLLRKHDIRLLLSEVCDECTSYAEWRPPKAEDGLDGVRTRLKADYYPDEAVDAIIAHFVGPKDSISSGDFGRIYSAVQVHLTQRGFADKLAEHGAGDLVRRVRTEWMTSAARSWTPKGKGVTHGADTPIWFWGNGERLKDGEKDVIRTFVGEVFWKFLSGEDVRKISWWRSLEGKPDHVRVLAEKGEVCNMADAHWEDGKRLWAALRESSWHQSW